LGERPSSVGNSAITSSQHMMKEHNKKERISHRVVMPFCRMEKEMGQS